MATNMVTISGMLTQRTARPNNSSSAPPASVKAAAQASNSGNGKPRPQSGLPNQAAVASISASLSCQPSRTPGPDIGATARDPENPGGEKRPGRPGDE